MTTSLRRFKFAVGVARLRTVTVYAKDVGSAMEKARAELDRRADRSGVEPPVAWDLTLLKDPRAEEKV